MTPTELYAALRGRGIVVWVEGNRLKARPWTALTPDEQAAFRKHRQKLKALVTGVVPAPPPASERPPATPPVPEDIRRIIAGEPRRTSAEATREMLESMRRHTQPFDFQPVRPARPRRF